MVLSSTSRQTSSSSPHQRHCFSTPPAPPPAGESFSLASLTRIISSLYLIAVFNFLIQRRWVYFPCGVLDSGGRPARSSPKNIRYGRETFFCFGLRQLLFSLFIVNMLFSKLCRVALLSVAATRAAAMTIAGKSNLKITGDGLQDLVTWDEHSLFVRGERILFYSYVLLEVDKSVTRV